MSLSKNNKQSCGIKARIMEEHKAKIIRDEEAWKNSGLPELRAKGSKRKKEPVMGYGYNPYDYE